MGMDCIFKAISSLWQSCCRFLRKERSIPELTEDARNENSTVEEQVGENQCFTTASQYSIVSETNKLNSNISPFSAHSSTSGNESERFHSESMLSELSKISSKESKSSNKSLLYKPIQHTDEHPGLTTQQCRRQIWQEQFPKEYEFQQQLFNQCTAHPYLENKFVEKEDAETLDIFKSFGCYYFNEVAKNNLSSGNMPGYRLSILRSVGLLCAAKVREGTTDEPSQISDIIADIWSSVISKANPDERLNQTVHGEQLLDLVKSTKDRLFETRSRTKNVLDNNENDPNGLSIIKLQQFNTREFKDIVTSIYQRCVRLVGFPPCEFDLMGLGSLAREELTPYSDFESAILLGILTNETTIEEQERIKDYFRSVALLFDIVMLNFGETMIPALNIPAFNDKVNGVDWFFDIITPSG